MFGNPGYFKPCTKGLPIPKKISGWMFYFGWLMAISGPCLTMVWMQKYIQSLVWLLIAVIWFTMDLVSTTRKVQRLTERERLFFVGDDESLLSTELYDLNLCRSEQEEPRH